ncbi:hypothetical protein [Oceaniglobus roseus]|uniref:hypothetical protein n=1 Tax=Oceaniglobus roseus TaxID=1737570 RepID=UPI000C7F5C88|nr:hypothetical protein [Kandeliimicrobium roseum]
MSVFPRWPVALALCIALATTATAQDAVEPHVSIELNALEAVDADCRISFVIRNGLASDISQAVYEVVLFDTAGRVERLTLFDFGTLPAARPRVRQFLVPGLACPTLGRMLVNGAETCDGAELPHDACTAGLDLLSRTDVEVLG